MIPTDMLQVIPVLTHLCDHMKMIAYFLQQTLCDQGKGGDVHQPILMVRSYLDPGEIRSHRSSQLGLRLRLLESYMEMEMLDVPSGFSKD